MSLPELRQPGYTVEDWKTWDGRWELIDGVPFDMTPSPSTEHQELSSNLHAAIWNALDEARRKPGGEDCRVFAAPTDVFLPSGVFIPDLLVVCDPAKITPKGIEGAPDLVVEILSPSTAQKDWTVKRWAYEGAGVPEYMIVNPDAQVVVLLHLVDGHYQEALRGAWGTELSILAGRISAKVGTPRA